MEESIKVYEILFGLEGEGFKTALKLFALAGQLRNDWLFEKASTEYINPLSEVEIFDSEGNSVGKIANSEMFFPMVYLGHDKRFTPLGKYTAGQPQLPIETTKALWEIHRIILSRMRRGYNALEYAVVAEQFGALLTNKEFEKAKRQALSNLR